MMKAEPRPPAPPLAPARPDERRRGRGRCRVAWCRDELGVTVNEMFVTEMNYVVGNSQAVWLARPGSMGRPYPGTAWP